MDAEMTELLAQLDMATERLKCANDRLEKAVREYISGMN
jgi:hypothetical protein